MNPGLCTSVVNYTVNSSDNCAGQIVTRNAGLASGAAFPAGTTLNQFTVNDLAGNSASCSFSVTVNDNQLPGITCPGNISQNNSPGLCGATVTYSVSSSDNCGTPLVTRTGGLASGSLFPIGITTNQFQTADAAGNSATCGFTVTITDAENPLISCPANTTRYTGSGVCSSVISGIAPLSSSDNCPGAGFGYSTTGVTVLTGVGDASGNTFQLGITTVQYVIADVPSNTATCSFTITLLDSIRPTIICPANISRGPDPGVCTAVVSYSVNANDNCPAFVTTLVSGLASGSIFPSGATTNTWRVTDGSGNTATCSFVVTITDTIVPTISCPSSSTVNMDPGLCTSVLNYTVNSNDNCVGFTTLLVSGPASGSVFSSGANVVTWRVTDLSGNSASCSFSVFVFDSIIPSLVCPVSVSVAPDSGICGAVITYSNPIANDNCPGFTSALFSGLASGSLFPMGITQNIWRATDAAGNTNTCSFSVTVTDSLFPIANCPGNITQNASPGNCSSNATFNVTFSDNCPGAILTQNSGFASGASFPVGVTTNLFRVTDLAGNTTTCSFLVTVNDTENPTIACPANIASGTDSGFCSASVTYLVTINDNCPGSNSNLISGLGSGAVFPSGTTTNSWRVTDASGNSASCSFTITVSDDDAPVPGCPGNINMNTAPGLCHRIVLYSLVSTDNCPGTITQNLLQGLSSGSMFPTGNTLNRFRVSDSLGNTSTCSFNVFISDIENPVLSACPANISVPTGLTNCSATVPWVVPTASDNCPGVMVSGSRNPGTVFNSGITTVSYTATDLAGNTSTCNFTVTVRDLQAPVITNCPSNSTVSTSPGICSAIVNWTIPQITDNCIGVIATASHLPGSIFPRGTTTVSYSATDSAGNTATCSFTIQVNDNQIPVVSCTNATVNLGPGGSVTINSGQVIGSSSDNCGIATSTFNPGVFDCTQTGANVVLITVTDSSGNSATCNSTVTVRDTIRPNAICQNPTVFLGVTGVVSVAAASINNGSTDNCGNVTLALNPNNFSCINVGVNPATLRVTDNSGNTSTCNSNITVLDTIRPIAICQNQSLFLNVNGTASITATLVNNGSTDNCGIANIIASPLNFNCNQSGNNNVNLTATDVNGNTATCNSVVTVVDTIGRNISCHNLTVWLNPSGTTTISAALVNNGSYTSCGIDSIYLSRNTFSCANVGANSIQFYLRDLTGGLDSCVSVITVLDITPPVISCPANFSTPADSGTCGATVSLSPTVSDNCTTSVSQTLGLPSGSVFPVGTTNQSFTVTDPSGNSASCSFTITVTGVSAGTLITADGPPILCNNDTLTLIGNPGYVSYLWSNGDANDSTEVFAFGNYSLLVTDAAGCNFTDTFFVDTIHAPDPNPIITPNGRVAICAGQPVDLDAGPGYSSYLWNTGSPLQVLHVTATGNYRVLVYNALGCSEYSDWVNVFSAPLPQPVVSLNGNIFTVNPFYPSYQWYHNGSFLPGETNQTLIASIPGNYRVEVRDSNGCVGSDSIVFVGREIVKGDLHSISIYPNPAKEVLFLASSVSVLENVSVNLLDLHGRIIKFWDFSFLSENQKLDISGISAGIYMLDVRVGKEQIIFKVVKE